MSPDVKCVVVEETWRTAEGQSIPSGHEWVEYSSTLVNVLDVPEFEEQESADETIMAVERSVDEEGDGVEVIPTDLVPDAVRKHPVPAPRSKLAAPVEPRIPVPVFHPYFTESVLPPKKKINGGFAVMGLQASHTS